MAIQLNWLFIALGGLFNMILGSLWYGPLFGKLWLRLRGKRAEEIQGGPVWMYLVILVASMVSALVLNVAVVGWGLTVWWQGALFGAILWVGIGAIGMMTTAFFEETRPGLWLLYSAYQIIIYAVEGAVFTL